MNPLALLSLPAIPAVSALILAVFGGALSYNAVGGLATLAAGLSFALALALLPLHLLGGGAPLTLDLGPWLSTHAFQAGLKLRLDSAAMCMVLLVTFFSFLITIYSIGYMREDREQPRFFAGLNLFLAAMLLLVLSDNLVLIFLGWEGVGLCSYLLIGHYWDETGVPLAAFRAFFVNRIGDVFFLLGVFMLYRAFGTVSLSELHAHGLELLPGHEWQAHMAALLLLGGAFAKSAQVPLHVWLADAMAGPTPVSALIHAATMVTAGVYLLMRLDWLYALVPEARVLIGVCALCTLVVGAFLALVQTDVKKILAYSTLANLALMFLALAAGSPGSAMLHLFGHAFFKALLFLAAGSVILSTHHEQDVRKLRGTLRHMPVTRIAFWVGCIGGAGLIPFFSAGFFTEDAVLESLRAVNLHAFGLHLSGGWLNGLATAVESLSALYMFRMLGYLSGDDREAAYAQGDAHGGDGHHAGGTPREKSRTVIAVLALLALAGPAFALFSSRPLLLHWVAGMAAIPEPMEWSRALPGVIVNLVLAACAFWIFSSSQRSQSLAAITGRARLGQVGPLTRKFYFDDVYALVFVWPLRAAGWLMRLLFENIFIGVLSALGWAAEGVSLLLRRLQSGRVQQYAAYLLLVAAVAAYFLLRN